jgi:hypothetical protein
MRIRWKHVANGLDWSLSSAAPVKTQYQQIDDSCEVSINIVLSSLQTAQSEDQTMPGLVDTGCTS